MTPVDYNAAEFAAGGLNFKHITELVRFWQVGHALEVDGKAGPLTIASVESSLASSTAGTSIAKARFLSCPLPVLPDGRRATITSSFRPPDRVNHDGCDWFYEWRDGDKPDFVGDKGAAGYTANHKPKWVVPIGVCAIAAAAGEVQIADDSSTGHRVWIDHGNGLRSGYFHLLDVRVRVGDRVSVGDVVGLVGDNPVDHDGRHLHFEVSPVGRYSPLDPEIYLLR